MASAVRWGGQVREEIMVGFFDVAVDTLTFAGDSGGDNFTIQVNSTGRLQTDAHCSQLRMTYTTLTRLTRFNPSDELDFAGQHVIEISPIGLRHPPPKPSRDMRAFSAVSGFGEHWVYPRL
jgi:hypothetical protein